jgi:hypothetical protein
MSSPATHAVPGTSRPKKPKMRQGTLKIHVISLKQNKDELDLAIASFFFATNEWNIPHLKH